MNDPPLRKIRSFVRREGRLTKGQQRALDTLWPRLGIEADGRPLDLRAVFGRTAPCYLEIGFGMGTSLAMMAQAMQQQDYLGIEVHRPGVGSLLMQIEELGLTNIRVMCGDAVEILERQIPDLSLDGVLLFFPDPWHKTRHHKRRIVQHPFIDLLSRKLKPGGKLHMATDWLAYAEHMLTVMGEREDFSNDAGAGNFSPRPDYRPITKFEQRGLRLGHGGWDLVFRRKKDL